MKKLMTAFAACMIAGLVSAAVESVNIVGYTTIGLTQGYSYQTAPFIPVGGDGSLFTLGMVVPNDLWDGGYGDTIQFIDESGATIRTAWYFAGFGWYDFDDASELNDLEIPAGTAGFVEATQEGAQFLVSGEVAGELTVPLPLGFALVGNPVAREITLGEVVPNEFWDGANGDTIQFMDESGATIRTAWYFAGFGWYDFDDASELGELPIVTGQGFFLEATVEGGELVFPAAI